jgi:hypothetical protein
VPLLVPLPLFVNDTDGGLGTFVHMNMFDADILVTAAAHPPESFYLRGKCSQELRGG